jgi:cytochrome-b5 reductase
LLVKKYDGGAMSSHIHGLKPGQTLDVKGPFAKLAYEPNKWKHVGLIAGGSGITPMVQLTRAILDNPNDKTTVSLVFANQTADDILLKDLFNLWASEHPSRFKVYYALDRPPAGWTGEKGFVSEALIKKIHFPAPGKGGLVGICGPDGMVAAVSGEKGPNKTQGEVGGVLKAMGYSSEEVYKF